jgi:uncharacterized protein (DUF433 family)
MWRDFVVSGGFVMDPYCIHDRGRGPELVGTRITVFDIIPYLRAGRSATYIASVFSLGTAQVEALMRYIDEHKEEVMAENRKIEERIARGNPPEVEARRAERHAKLLALKAELERNNSQGGANGTGNPG